jgi:hypothetical protein
MSIKLMTAVWERIDLTSTQKLVLLALADWANDEGLCWPSIDRVAVKASLKRRAVQMTIRSLEESGFLRREELVGRGNKYWVNIPVQNMHPCINDTLPAHEMHPTRASDAPNTSKTHQLTTKSNIPAQPEGVSDEVWKDFIDLRKAKRAPLNATAMKIIEREAVKAGWTLNDALSESVARGWQGFKADWVKERTKGNGSRETESMGRTERAAIQALRDLGFAQAAPGASQSGSDALPTAGRNGIVGNQSSPLLTIGYDGSGSGGVVEGGTDDNR